MCVRDFLRRTILDKYVWPHPRAVATTDATDDDDMTIMRARALPNHLHTYAQHTHTHKHVRAHIWRNMQMFTAHSLTRAHMGMKRALYGFEARMMVFIFA